MGNRGWFDQYDILLCIMGLALVFITLGRRRIDQLHLNTTYIYLVVGILAGPALLRILPGDAQQGMTVLMRISEAAVIISLIVLGIRIGRPIGWSTWQSTVRLVLIVMPITIAAVAAAGMWLLDLALGPAVLLGAILAPTDPILAGPLEEKSSEDESEDRFGLSSEAGLNDGLAFPFVYLGLYLTLSPEPWASWIGYWFFGDLLYAVAIALPVGWILGRQSGRLYLRSMAQDQVSRKRRLFVPLAVLLFVYGLVEVLGAYGFLASFTAGLGFRRALSNEDVLDAFADFSESLDEVAKAAVLIFVGALLPWAQFGALGWPLLAFALTLILIIRPLATWIATAGGGFSHRDRLYWAWFGLRGIGSIYYLSYALDRGVDDSAATALFTIATGTVVVSILLHGASLRPFLKHFGERAV
jgi:sodium/hydrogen antiporter